VCNVRKKKLRSRNGWKIFRRLHRKKGGKCLSTEYINNTTKLIWKCKEGHVWGMIYTVIQRGGWCIRCRKEEEKSKCFKDVQKIAEKKGGKCLSIKYVNKDTKLKWQCRDGHVWMATPNSVKSSDSWCPYCAGIVRQTIEDMRELAKSKNGKCLSPKYVNTKTKLKWQCAQGHVWRSQPAAIVYGQWCPYCAGNIKRSIEEMKILARQRGGICLSSK
jgi:hypothetical protein